MIDRFEPRALTILVMLLVASLSVTGNAIWQWAAAIGLTVKLGG